MNLSALGNDNEYYLQNHLKLKIDGVLVVFHMVVCVSCGCLLIGFRVVVVVCVSCGGCAGWGRGTSEKKLLAGRSIRPAMMDRPDQINDWTKALHPSDGAPRPHFGQKSFFFRVFEKRFV